MADISLRSSDRLNGRLRRLGMKLQHCMINIEYLQGDDNGLAYVLSREERRDETIAEDGLQSNTGGCGEVPSTEEEEERPLGERTLNKEI